MKKVSIIAIVLLVAGSSLLLVWLHDLRASNAAAEVQREISEKQLVVSKLTKSTVILHEFLASDDPASTRLAAEAKRQNPDTTDAQFAAWLATNAASLRTKCEDDIRNMPAVIAEKEEELAGLKEQLKASGPWLFYR